LSSRIINQCNSTWHATKISISLIIEPTCIELFIEDNGIGIKDIKYGFGLKGMEERLKSIQGSLNIGSNMNKGTIFTCFLPIIKRYREGMSEGDKSTASR
jgi:glucose-6-phosphate-specific signal transduction histidine kinase